MSPRPAPEYGEYATPEEVAEITGRPMPEAAPRAPEGSVPGESAAATSTSEVPGSASRPTSRVHPDDVDPSSVDRPLADGQGGGRVLARRRPRSVWDTALTLGFLASGAWYAGTALSDPHRFGEALQANAERMGWDGSLGGPLTDGVGLGVAITVSLLVVLTAAIAWIGAKRLRRVWWIPACGAVLSFVVNLVGFAIVMAAHPDFLDFISTR